MIYKVNDKVRIKTWEQLLKEYQREGTNSLGSFIMAGREFYYSFNYLLDKTNREVTINRIYFNRSGIYEYGLLGHSFIIHEYWIEEPFIHESINDRWEILDL